MLSERDTPWQSPARSRALTLLLLGGMGTMSSPPTIAGAEADPTTDSETGLAKKLANPVAALIRGP